MRGSIVSTRAGGIPRYRTFVGPTLFQAGFRPFFLFAGLWAALGLLLWQLAFVGRIQLPTAFDPLAWHMHEMLFGFGMAAVAGFMLTAIPNWTGRLPLQGAPLALLFALWLAGRAAGLGSAATGPAFAAAVDLAFPALLLLVVVREIAAGRNWRNLPMVAALGLLLIANALMHAESLAFAETTMLGARLGLAVLLLLTASLNL